MPEVGGLQAKFSCKLYDYWRSPEDYYVDPPLAISPFLNMNEIFIPN